MGGHFGQKSRFYYERSRYTMKGWDFNMNSREQYLERLRFCWWQVENFAIKRSRFWWWQVEISMMAGRDFLDDRSRFLTRSHVQLKNTTWNLSPCRSRKPEYWKNSVLVLEIMKPLTIVTNSFMLDVAGWQIHIWNNLTYAHCQWYWCCHPNAWQIRH